MINQLLPRLAIKTIEVLIRKGSEQQLCLIEPTGMGRGIHRPHARMRGEVGRGVVLNMRPAIVQNQMNAPRTPIAAFHLPDTPQEVLVVVSLQTAPPHHAIIDIEGHQKRDRPMPFILKLTPLNLARLQGLPGHKSRQSLDVRFLIHADYHFPALVEPVNALITPQHLGGQGCELRINRGGLPIAAAMRLQARFRQYARHRRVVDCVYHPLLNDDLL